MRWSLWLALIGLLAIPGHHHLTQRWDLTLVMVLAVVLMGLGYDARHRTRARLLYRRGAEVRPRAVRATSRTGPTVLNRDEQQQFRAIEERLVNEDPEFAERIRALEHTGRPAAARLTAAIGLGLAVAVIGFVTDPALIVMGLSIAVAAFGIRLLVISPRQPHPVVGPDEDAPPGADRGAPV